MTSSMLQPRLPVERAKGGNCATPLSSACRERQSIARKAIDLSYIVLQSYARLNYIIRENTPLSSEILSLNALQESFLSVDVLPIIGDVLAGAGLHGGGSLGPAGRTNFSVLGVVLEGLNQPQVFADVPANSQIVDTAVPEDLVVVNDESASQGESSVIEHSIVRGDLLLDIGNEGDVDVAETSLAAGLMGPSSMDEVGVDGASEDFTAALPEGLGVVAELYDFCRADESEVEGIEKEEYPLVLVVGEGEFLEFSSRGDPGVGPEEGGCFADDCLDCLTCHKIYLSKIPESYTINRNLHVSARSNHFSPLCRGYNSSGQRHYKPEIQLVSGTGMEKFTDSTLNETITPGLYSQADIYDIEALQKIKNATDLSLMCNRVCFKNYKAQMTSQEGECHQRCFDNFYAAMLFHQNKFYEEINKK